MFKQINHYKFYFSSNPQGNESSDSLESIQEKKMKGNTAFRAGNFKEAFKLYSEGLKLCQNNDSERIILLSNRLI